MDDNRELLLTADVVGGYGFHDWEAIRSALSEWEQKGFLKVLKDPEDCSPTELCVKMRSYIERGSPWPDWPPKEE